MKYLILSIVALSLSVLTYGQYKPEFTHPDILSFEDGQKLFASESKGSTLDITPDHFKHGKKSLSWKWEATNSSIHINKTIRWTPDPTDMPDPSTSTFIFWAYSKQAQPNARLRFEFIKKGKVCSWFDYGLNFTGWRGAWIAFERDMQGKPEPDMDQLKITVLNSERGQIILDHIILSSYQDLRQHTADTQAPFINKDVTGHWLLGEKSTHYQFDLPIDSNVSPKEIQEIKKIEDRFIDFILEDKKPLSLPTLRESLARFEIQTNTDGTRQGKPLFFTRYGETYFSMGHPRNTRVFSQTVADIEDANKLLLQLATSFHLSADTAVQRETTQMFLTLTNYMLDQGWSYGSALGTIHHLGYSMRNFYPAFLLMKPQLYTAGLGAEIQKAMEWFCIAAEVKLLPTVPGIDIDIFNTNLLARLASILMLPDSGEKITYMHSFVRWLNNGFAPAPGLTATFKIDGSVHHHCNNYPAYARDGIRGATEGVYLLSGTDFSVSQVAHEQLKKALLTMRFYCNLQNWPISMSGRHPKGNESLTPSQYARLALAGTPDKRQKIDPEMAAAYLRLMNGKENRFTQLFKDNRITAEKSPVGNLSLPYACVMIQRRDDWSAVVRGHSRYLWAAESYYKANHYGRYLAHGNLQINASGNPINNEASGYVQKGWDWNHWWGITSTILPAKELRANILNVDPQSGFEEMLFSDEAFAGSASIGSQNGAFGMKLHEHDKYNGSLRARKSYFFFDNRIVCLGTNIESKIKDHPTETTLFQEFIPQNGNTIQVNGKPIGQLDYQFQSQEKSWIQDGQGNIYYIPSGALRVTRKLQHSLDQSTDEPTENNFSLATLSHGNAPQDGSYEYAILVKPDQNQANDWIKNMDSKKRPYRVIQQNREAHIVQDYSSATTAYILFEAGQIKGKQLIQENSLPCIILEQELSKNEILISVADPDLHLYEGPSDDKIDENGKRIERSIYSKPWISNESNPSNARITLKGAWKLAEVNPYYQIISTDKAQTIIEISCQHGLSRECKLIRK